MPAFRRGCMHPIWMRLRRRVARILSSPPLGWRRSWLLFGILWASPPSGRSLPGAIQIRTRLQPRRMFGSPFEGSKPSRPCSPKREKHRWFAAMHTLARFRVPTHSHRPPLPISKPRRSRSAPCEVGISGVYAWWPRGGEQLFETAQYRNCYCSLSHHLVGMRLKHFSFMMAALMLAACGPSASKEISSAKGSWHADASSGCEIWSYSGKDPTGPMKWSGDCVDGKAEGLGKLSWAANPSRIPFGSEVSFEGKIIAGQINGPGVWTIVDTFSNVIHSTRIEAVWRNGEIEGIGKYIRRGNFIDNRNTLNAVVTYEGEFENREFWGQGRREEITEYRDNRSKHIIEDGRFENNMLSGYGMRWSETQSPDGDRRVEHTVGLHENREFVGRGTLNYEYGSQEGIYRSFSTFKHDRWKGGIGNVTYANGDRFTGKIDGLGSPISGECAFFSIGYQGECLNKSFEVGDTAGIICMVSDKDKNTCLKEIGRWVF